MKNWLLSGVAVSALAGVPLLTQAAEQTLVPTQSEITFVAKQLGVPMDGRFKRFAAQTAFDPHQLPTSKIALQIELGSVSLNPEADVELVKPDWFNAAQFPKATFQSSAIKALGGGRFEVTGKLAIKGHARDLVVPVQLSQAKGLSTAVGSFVIKRLDFKVGDGEWADPSLVTNDVQVKFKLVLQGVPAL
ncbi:MAG: YceI family protein [Burkholderiales bacterium]|nr:YceI family protein [Burkholderiales bacterium]